MSTSSVKKLPHSTLELTFHLDPVKLEIAREAAFNKVASQIKVQGFRVGKAPKKLLEERVNTSTVMQMALDEVLNEAYKEALTEQSIAPIAQPEVNISSTDLTKPIEVIAQVQVQPEITVGDWQKISVKKTAESVDEAKVDETLQSIFERSIQGAEEEGGLVGADGQPLKAKQPATPDDAWAKKLGAKDLADLRDQVRIDLVTHAEYEAETAWQDKVMEELISLTEADLPPAFIEDEMNRMRSQFEQQLSGLNLTFAQYAEQAGKTVEEIESTWKPQAEKQAMMEVALAEIAHQEKIEATEAEVDAELEKAEPKLRQQFSDPQQRYYLMYSLWRQKVIKHILATVKDNGSKSGK